ncbi:MAG: ImmA/IrrE family metallo-endopeptidase, partial [Deltaproteobacteria bacterium]|nr:ImmA/IrrE family metallo-endopeptidase [Deltaproteobacteria bacterium]
MSNAFITPKVLQWAIERSSLSSNIVAEKAKVKVDQLTSWLKGDARPRFNQAEKLARVLHVPFGYLFLSSPPEEKPALPDLRTFRDVNLPQSFSADFYELLSNVLVKQQWYQGYLHEEGAKSLKFIGRFKKEDESISIAEDIAKTLNINRKFRQDARSWEDFLGKLIRQAESEGILVLRSGIVGSQTRRTLSVQEFRGFNICDKLAPLIFINGRDAKAAQIFTFAHELAHLWIGESGISNQDIGKPKKNKSQKIESLCDLVAAELLVPEKQFLEDWQAGISIENNLKKLVRHYRVSSVVILRRAYELKKISRDDFFASYKQEQEKYKSKTERKGGGNYYLNL